MKIVTVVGARPQFIKASCVSRLLRDCIQEVIVHTGQHYDDNMSAVFFQQLQLPQPSYYLGVGSNTHGKQTARMIEEVENVLFTENPDMVLVYGDTNSTLAGSLAASKLDIPIAHVESGLRSFNRKMPEEINRIITDHLSSLLFCPTSGAVKNLKNEGIQKNVHMVGDVMYDSVLLYKEIARKQSIILDSLQLSSRQYYLATIHRAENTSQPDIIKKLLNTFLQLDHVVVIPLHPRTEKLIHNWKLDHMLAPPKIKAVPPLSYLDMLQLQSEASFILTDSGGIQKEAYMLQVPCITLRNETEWVETVAAGWNYIVGTEGDLILETIANLKVPKKSPPIFGDGHAARKICQVLASWQR